MRVNSPLSQKQIWILVLLWAVALACTVAGTRDRLTWAMETFPVFLASIALLWTNKSFPLPRLVLFFIFLHGLVLILGGFYTYAEVPLGFWLQDVFGLARNPYDRIGHFMQGFVPALVAREILYRKVEIRRPGWLFFLVVCICLAISACYEFIEWWAALLLNQGAEAFLGTQGDSWDTQWDMFLAGIGAVTAQLVIRQSEIRPKDQA